MSYVFEIDELTVWSPALRTGNIYAGFVNVVEEEFRQGTGFTAIASDMVRIDGPVFARFVNLLLNALDAPNVNSVLAWLLRSILGPSVVMLQRAGCSDDLNVVESVVREAELLEPRMPC